MNRKRRYRPKCDCPQKDCGDGYHSGWCAEIRHNISHPTMFLVTTFGHYPIGIFSSREEAEARVAKEHAYRRSVKGMAPGEFRIIEMEIDGDYKHEVSVMGEKDG